MPNNHTDTILDFSNIVDNSKNTNNKILSDYLYLYYRCDEIISKIKERKEKPNIERSNNAIR